MKDKKIFKIVVPVIMVLIVIGIFIYQSRPDKIEQATTSAVIEGASTDFALNSTSIDLDNLKSYGLPMIIDFGADECVPCVEMAPVLVSVNQEMMEKAIIKFVDVWKSPEAATGFPVQVIPTQVIYNADGTPYVPSDAVAGQIVFSMYAHRETEEHLFTTHQGGLTEEQMLLILEDMGVEV